MPLLLLKFLPEIATAILVAMLSLGAHKLDVHRIEAKQRQAIQEQEQLLTASCNADKAITSEVSHEFQLKNRALASQLVKLKRVRPSACIPVQSSQPAARHDAATGTGESAGPHGIDADSLRDFAAESERYGIQLDACQDFIRRERDKGIAR